MLHDRRPHGTAPRLEEQLCWMSSAMVCRHILRLLFYFLEILGNYLKELKVSKIAMVGKRLLFIFFVVLLSQTGNGALQLPLGKQTNSDAPISELPLAHDSITRELNFVSFELRISPRLAGISGQFMAYNRMFSCAYTQRFCFFFILMALP